MLNQRWQMEDDARGRMEEPWGRMGWVPTSWHNVGGGTQCQDSKQVSLNQLECLDERAGKAGVCGGGGEGG